MLRPELLLVSSSLSMEATFVTTREHAAPRSSARLGTRTDAAWAALRAGLRRFVARRAAPADIDDLVQEILLRATAEGPDRGALTPHFVFGIARHVVADHHRRRAREHARLSRLAEEPDDRDGEPLSSVQADVASALALFLSALPQQHQAAVRAVDVEGRAQADVAREHGVPLSTVRSRVQRGRAELRALLRRHCEVELDARGQVVSCEPRAGRRGAGGCADTASEAACGACAAAAP